MNLKRQKIVLPGSGPGDEVSGGGSGSVFRGDDLCRLPVS